jgi:hypothetical protein
MKVALSIFLPFAVGIPSLAVGLFFHSGVASGILIGFGLGITIFSQTLRKNS